MRSAAGPPPCNPALCDRPQEAIEALPWQRMDTATVPVAGVPEAGSIAIGRTELGVWNLQLLLDRTAAEMAIVWPSAASAPVPPAMASAIAARKAAWKVRTGMASPGRRGFAAISY